MEIEIYDCKCCSFVTDVKFNFKRHLKSNKHILKSQIENKNQIKNLNTPIPFLNAFHCEYCNKEFTMKNSMIRHMNERCKENKNKDLTKLVKKMNKESKKDKKTIEILQKQIDKMGPKVEININTTNIQNNIILAYRETDTTHLIENDYVNAIKKVNMSINYLIEKIHFNPEKPENMNIYISNIKNKYLMLFENGTWKMKTRRKEIERLIEDKEDLINEWIENNKNKHPELKPKIQRYINNKNDKDDPSIDFIKDEVELLLYNKKNMITNG
jgi:ElaB/YqjD/DUF883 family membrane-anchored ribosome-binding protein